MEPGPHLRCGRRDLDGLRGVEILGDFAWFERERAWAIALRLTRDGPESRLVPRSSDWYVLLGADYPWGRLKFAPAKDGGLTSTFPHQDYNAEGSGNLPWRKGELCLNSTAFTLGRGASGDEPFGDCGRDGRLRWHVLRALSWLESAASGELMPVGDHYELPCFPRTAHSDTTVAFIEDGQSFLEWSRIDQRSGIVQITAMAAEPSVKLVTGFHTSHGRILLPIEWGDGLRRPPSSEFGAWIRLKETACLKPWQAPRTWPELCEVVSRSGHSLDSLLFQVLRHLRDGQEHVLLIGFPIPARVGEEPSRMHWQPLLLPVLCQGDQSLSGFRPNRESTRFYSDRKRILTRSSSIEWLRSENWEAAQLGSRGRLSDGLTKRRVLVLGCGSLGSAVAELLRRAGVSRLTLVDGESVEAGNLCRHLLTLADVKGNKAQALSLRLNEISPHGLVDHVAERFPPSDEGRRKIEPCEVVIDCTAENGVIHELREYPWAGQRRFISLSLGFGARRLFCFTVDACTFPSEVFHASISPWLLREQQERDPGEFPREGIGCWHPVFPARADDVWLMASTTVKFIDSTFGDDYTLPRLVVFEQKYEDGVFSGVGRAKNEVGSHG